MKITLEKTAAFADLSGNVKARIWRGTTETGIEVHAFIALIAVDQADDRAADFLRELTEVAPRVEQHEELPLRLSLD